MSNLGGGSHDRRSHETACLLHAREDGLELSRRGTLVCQCEEICALEAQLAASCPEVLELLQAPREDEGVAGVAAVPLRHGRRARIRAVY